jgi:RimJ/RimL family protein N-acetyltransferase
MRPGSPILETERLSLRELELSDLDFVAEMLGDPEVMRFYPSTCDRSAALAWIRKQLSRYASDGHGLWLVEECRTGRPVGQVGLAMQQVGDRREPEIGYLIHRPYWRQGFAHEAAVATRDHALGPLGLDRVISLVRPVNVPSRALARKLGMRLERAVSFAGLEHLLYAFERVPPRPDRAGHEGSVEAGA